MIRCVTVDTAQLLASGSNNPGYAIVHISRLRMGVSLGPLRFLVRVSRVARGVCHELKSLRGQL